MYASTYFSGTYDFKFHSGYIYTIMTKLWVDSINFKFHSGYIYTLTEYNYMTFNMNFKFHSGYIYTNNIKSNAYIYKL